MQPSIFDWFNEGVSESEEMVLPDPLALLMEVDTLATR